MNAALLYPFILVAGALQALGNSMNAQLRGHLVNEAALEDDVLEKDKVEDPRFKMTAEELKAKGIEDFQLSYAADTLRRTAGHALARSGNTINRNRASHHQCNLCITRTTETVCAARLSKTPKCAKQHQVTMVSTVRILLVT